VSGVFQVAPGCPSVEGVSYEVYTKQYSDRLSETREWIIVHYTGGGWAPKIVNGNSNMANFVVIGSLLAGGHYEEVRMYEEQTALGFQRLEL
jgi:hypothetical protein